MAGIGLLVAWANAEPWFLSMAGIDPADAPTARERVLASVDAMLEAGAAARERAHDRSV